MGFDVSFYTSKLFGTTAENRALLDIGRRLRRVALPTSDPYNGENAPLWVFVEPHIELLSNIRQRRYARPDLIIAKRNAMIVVEMKNHWGRISIPLEASQKDAPWRYTTSDKRDFGHQPRNPFQQVRNHERVLQEWLREQQRKGVSPHFNMADLKQILPAILFTHPDVSFTHPAPSYMQKVRLTTLHGVQHTDSFTELIITAASGTVSSSIDARPRLSIEQYDVDCLAAALGMEPWFPEDEHRNVFLAPVAQISVRKNTTSDVRTKVSCDTDLQGAPVQIRLIEFYKRLMIEEARSNPDVNFRLTKKSNAKHFVLPSAPEVIIARAGTVRIEAEAIPQPVQEAESLAYGLFWQTKTDPQSGLSTGSPLFHTAVRLVKCADATELEIQSITSGDVELNVELLKEMRPFSVMDEDEIDAFIKEYSTLPRQHRIAFVLNQLEHLADTQYTPGMLLTATLPPNADLTHAGIVFVPDRMSTRNVIQDLEQISSIWRNHVRTGSTPSDLAWKFLTPGVTFDQQSNVRLSDRSISLVNYEQARGVSLATSKGNEVVVIQGPPGTGKTRLLANICSTASIIKETLLLASTNNSAIANVVDAANSVAQFPLVFRLGSKQVMDESGSMLNAYAPVAMKLNDKKMLAEAESYRAKVVSYDQPLQVLAEQFTELVSIQQQLHDLELRIRSYESKSPIAHQLMHTQTSSLASYADRVQFFDAHFLDVLQGERSALARIRNLFRKGAPFKGVFSSALYMSWCKDCMERSFASIPPEIVADMLLASHVDAEHKNRRLQFISYVANRTQASELARLEAAHDSQALHSNWSSTKQQQVDVLQNILKYFRAPGFDDRHRDFDRLQASTDSASIGQLSDKLSPVACTLGSLRRSFDCSPGSIALVAIDEASQCGLGAAIPALYRARRVVVVGDRKQLQPISTLTQATIDAIALECSVDEPELALLSNPITSLQTLAEYHLTATVEAPMIMLRDHHRSVPEIIGFSNNQFYGGLLRIKRSNASKSALAWHDVFGEEINKVNQSEVEALLPLISELRAAGLQAADIGIVTPFSFQKEAIVDCLAAELGDDALHSSTNEGIFVNTVHGFQGIERNTVILSTVITPVSRVGRREFVTWGPKAEMLINVATTRATDRFIVVGHPQAAKGVLGDLRQWILSGG